MPGLDRWINRNPLWLKLSHPTYPLADLAVSKLQARKAAHPSPQRDLLQKYIEASEQNPDSIPLDVVVGLTMSTIAAGALTTSNTLAIFFYHMARNLNKLTKLEKSLMMLWQRIP
ncbi:hypothetical protein GJ744_001769 [Endocarpon pusillum]|uniref:Cytochrome P450 n=1 Tax=Endocarpon pusillum TaxID=364733 RepID=A0A8H7A917_9EURO|nr:hypothetical protein GJ744_001769 [Endocarpon pusillum]